MLNKEFKIHICQDGTLTYRHNSEQVFNGRALPCYSTDTREKAQELITLIGVVQYKEHPLLPGQPWFVYPNFGGEVEDITKATAKFRYMEELTQGKQKNCKKCGCVTRIKLKAKAENRGKKGYK